MVKKIIVTTSWDDNSYENLEMIELLNRFRIRGTFYINSETDNRGRHVKQNRIKEMITKIANSGHEVGSHTKNHVILTESQNLYEEIEQSKYDLEKLTKRKVIAFCYPNGVYDDHIKDMVKNSGYVCARTCKYGGIGFPKDPYELGITLHASNGSPRLTFKIWRESGTSIKSLLDWEIRAKLLFDLVLEKGGIWHLWGHSWEIELHKDWHKLARVLQYVSNRKEALYLENGKIFKDNLYRE